MKEKTSAGAVKIEQAECNQARLRLLRRSLFYLKNLSKKLHAIDILRKFASGKAVVSDCLRTLRTSKMISITPPFDSRKSRKLKRISQGIASDVHALYRAWAAPAVLLIRVVREPTWAKCRRVCPRHLFLLIAIMPMAATAQNSLHAESIRTYKLKNSKTYHKLKNSKTQHNTMPQIIKIGGGLFSSGELIRINPSNNSIESSGNGGRSWIPRCTNASYGTFRDLLLVDREILAATSRGLYVSTNAGRSFSPRCVNTSYGDFLNLQDEGNTLLANTSKGLYYSTNGGRSWVRR